MADKKFQFKSTDSNLKHRNGQFASVTGVITEADAEHDAEVLPMLKIQFGDGYATEVWEDELIGYGKDDNRGNI